MLIAKCINLYHKSGLWLVCSHSYCEFGCQLVVPSLIPIISRLDVLLVPQYLICVGHLSFLLSMVYDYLSVVIVSNIKDNLVVHLSSKDLKVCI